MRQQKFANLIRLFLLFTSCGAVFYRKQMESDYVYPQNEFWSLIAIFIWLGQKSRPGWRKLVFHLCVRSIRQNRVCQHTSGRFWLQLLWSSRQSLLGFVYKGSKFRKPISDREKENNISTRSLWILTKVQLGIILGVPRHGLKNY